MRFISLEQTHEKKIRELRLTKYAQKQQQKNGNKDVTPSRKSPISLQSQLPACSNAPIYTPRIS